jgi:hypothetical protein
VFTRQLTPGAHFGRLPPGLRAALVELLGEEAVEVRLVERSWRVRWHPRALATTRRNRIYLRGSIEEFARNAEVVLHEYFHVLEQWRPRRLTRTRYIWEWLRRGYWHNRFEVEAREYVARNLRDFRRLIARAEAPRQPANPGSLRADTGGPRAT